VAGDIALVKRAEAVGLDSADGVLGLIDQARHGSAAADALLEARARAVGAALGPLADLLEPQRIVIAGGMMSSPEYLPALRESAVATIRQANLADTDIILSSFGPASLVVCSAALVLRSVYNDPASFSSLARTS
jgi:predicted NBD/HSP70 family sugar kinase